MVLSHDHSAEKLQNGVLLQVDCIKAYLVFRKTPKELETRLASSNSQRRRKKLIRPCSKIASGRSTGSSTFGTTTSLEMNKRFSQSYQWRCLRIYMRFFEGVQQFSWLRSISNKSQSEKILCLSCRQRSLCTSTLKLWRRFGSSRWQMFWLHEDVYRKHSLNLGLNLGLWKRSPWRTGSQVEAGGWNRYENILFIFHIQYFTASVVALSPHAGVLPWGFCLQEGRRWQGDVHY